MSTTQNPAIKGNPWLPTYDGTADRWLVPSASDDAVIYPVSLSAAALGIFPDACRCLAAQNGRRCWHVSTVELRIHLDDTADHCRAYYATFTPGALRQEDERLRALIDAGEAGPFLLTQYAALGDEVGSRTARPIAA